MHSRICLYLEDLFLGGRGRGEHGLVWSGVGAIKLSGIVNMLELYLCNISLGGEMYPVPLPSNKPLAHFYCRYVRALKMPNSCLAQLGAVTVEAAVLLAAL